MIGCLLLLVALYLYWNKRFYSSLLLFFFFITNGFQVVPVQILMAGLPLDKGNDLALLYVVAIAVMKRRTLKAALLQYPLFKWCMILIGFVLLDAVFSLAALGYPLTNVVQVFRPWLFFLSFLVFLPLPAEDLERVIHSLAFITVVQSCLFLMQIVTGKLFLYSASGTEEVVTNVLSSSGGYVRYYNTPVLLSPALFYYLFAWQGKSGLFRLAAIGILACTVIGPMHRSAILAMVAVISLYVLLKQKSSRRVSYLAVIGVALYAVSMVGVVGDRLDEAFADIGNTLSADLSVENIDINENTTLFRIGHLVERFDYVVHDARMGWLFGIGLISDNSPLAGQLPFQFGLVSDVTGMVTQVDTSDLIWSLLFLNLGIAGTLLYVFIFSKWMVTFFNNIINSRYAIVGFMMIVYALMLSMAGVLMLENSFRVLVLLLLTLVMKNTAKQPI